MEWKSCRPVWPVLIAVVGVDVEAEDGVYFNWLCAAHRGAELPTRQRGHDLGGHGGRAGLKHLQLSQVAGCIEFAFDYHASVSQAGGQISAQALRADRCTPAGVSSGI